MQIQKLRFARPTQDPQALHAFYADGLGLAFLGDFRDHAGYDGYLYGTLDGRCEIEFTHRAGEGPCPPPSGDNLIVFYLPNRAAIDPIAARLRAAGVEPVAPDNPYWATRGLTFADPEGWRVVLFDLETMKRA